MPAPFAAFADLRSMLPVWLGSLLESRVTLVFGLVFLVLFVVTLVGLPVLITRMPSDYFVRPRTLNRRGGARWFGRVAGNFAGVILLLLGIAMLVLPGQGLLTILVALVLLDFPGKRRFERWLVHRPKVLAVLNALRSRVSRPPFVID
jgi:hypothetical protein